MKKNLGVGVALLIVLIAGIAGAWWWLRPAPAPPTDAFAKLPGGFVAAWQADWASLRRSPLVQQALQRASRLPVDPAHVARLGQADWISGVILPGGRPVIAMEGPGLSFVSAAAAGTTAAPQLAELSPLPKGQDFWLVIDPRSTGPLTIGPIQGLTLQFPSELLSSARRIAAYGKVGAFSFELAAEAEYPQPEDATRLASSLNGFLGLLRKLALRGRSASADEAVKLFWDSLEVTTEGSRLLVRARLNEISLARVLILAGP